jgi:hypothetical protein
MLGLHHSGNVFQRDPTIDRFVRDLPDRIVMRWCDIYLSCNKQVIALLGSPHNANEKFDYGVNSEAATFDCALHRGLISRSRTS